MFKVGIVIFRCWFTVIVFITNIIIHNTIINFIVTNCIVSATIISFPVGEDTFDDTHNMDQNFDCNNSLNYDRDGKLAPGEAEISNFHDYSSEPYRSPLLNVMKQTQVNQSFSYLVKKVTMVSVFHVFQQLFHFYVFIIFHHQYIT